jgi:hypothetical protein
MNTCNPPDHGVTITHFAQSVKDRIEVHQDLPLGYLGDVVQTFGGEVSHAVLHVCEAIEERIYKLLHVRRNSYTESDSCPSQSDQSSVPNVERVGRIAEHFDKLIHNLADTFVVPLQITFSCKPENRRLTR